VVASNPPLELTEAELEIWKVTAARVVPGSIDATTLAVLCRNLSEYWSYRQLARETNSWVYTEHAEALRLWVREQAVTLRLLPERRLRIAGVNSQGDDEDLERLFGGARLAARAGGGPMSGNG
jgi:hypothetical protein